MAGLFGSQPASSTTANTLGELKNDIALNSPPEDSISDLSFSPTANFLAVASWDKSLSVYEINNTGGIGRAKFSTEAPVLSCHWSPVSIALCIAGRKELLTIS